MSSTSIKEEVSEPVIIQDKSEKYSEVLQLKECKINNEYMVQSVNYSCTWFKDETELSYLGGRSGNNIDNTKLSEVNRTDNNPTSVSQHNSNAENQNTKQNIEQSTSSILYQNNQCQDDDYLEEDSVFQDDEFDDFRDDWYQYEAYEKGVKSKKININLKYHEHYDAHNKEHDVLFSPTWKAAVALNFGMKPSYAAANQLETYSRKSKKYKMQENKKNVAATKTRVDKSTRLLLNNLIKDKIIVKVNGIMCRGKEALILHADCEMGLDTLCRWNRCCVLKVFKPALNDSKQLDQYIKEDYRFKDRFPEPCSAVDINMWAEKEKLNIEQLKKYDIPCPHVILHKKNILVMSFLGYNRSPAPKLKYARLSDYNLRSAYEQIIKSMQVMYKRASLVHADLSEHNILWHDWKCYLIHFAQAVDSTHPMALEYLMRDCCRITSYFQRCGLKVKTKEKLFESITSITIDEYKKILVESIRSRGKLVT